MPSRFLGAYLIAIAVLQFALYVAALDDPLRSLLFLDPRIGLVVIEDFLFDYGETRYPVVVSWLSASCLLVVGVLMRCRHLGLRTYAVVESIVAVPTFLLLLGTSAILLTARFPTNGPTPWQYAELLAVFAATSVVPVLYAVRCSRKT